jgi:hypothetical protein
MDHHRSSPPHTSRYELKGSAFTSPFDRAAPALKNTAAATMQDNDTGFRCVSRAWIATHPAR